MASVEQWVGDKLHEILGISDRAIAEYFVGMAKKSGSADDFIQNLKDTGTVDIDAAMTNFASELWSKVIINIYVPCLMLQQHSLWTVCGIYAPGIREFMRFLSRSPIKSRRRNCPK